MVVLLLAACSASAAAPFRATGDPRPLPREGAVEPASGGDFEGILVGLRGRPVVVNLWASWCGPCRVEAPLLERAAKEYAGKVVFLGVDSHDQLAPGRRFLDRYSITYPNVFDESGEIATLLRYRAFPTTYVFGADGRLRSQVVGGISERSLAAHLNDVLAR